MTKTKECSVEWIGRIPEDWKLKRLKMVLQERNENNNPVKTDYILSLTNDKGVIPYSEKGDIGNKSKDDITGYKLAYPNDIVLNSMNVVIGSVGISNYFGAVSPVYYMLRPRNKKDDVRFYNYIFQTREFQNKLKGYGNGILEIRMRIQMLKLNTVELPVPSSEEQVKIAEFLDKKCSQIDELIKIQEKEIENLKQYKQAVISEVVTKGLNSNVKMKDSGIEWIGYLPEDWKIGKLKYITNLITDGTHQTPTYVSDGIPFISIKDISSGKIDFSDCKYISEMEHQTLYRHAPIEKGDMLFTRIGTLGIFIIVDTITVFDIFVSVGLIKFKRNVSLTLKKFIKYYFSSKNFLDFINLVKAGGETAAAKFNLEDVKNSAFTLPQNAEMKNIVEFLDNKTNKVDELINQKQQKIEALQRYKKSLIYEYVTGKKRCV